MLLPSPLLAAAAGPLPLPLAAVAPPLFGNVWLALLAIVAGIALLLGLVAAVGHVLAATHPAPPVPAADLEAAGDDALPSLAPEVVAVIAASVAHALGAGARIAAVRLAHGPAPSVEALMQQWSLEGRREIYGSHKVR